MAEESHAAPGGLFESLKTLSVSRIAILQTRLEFLPTALAAFREAHRLTALGFGVWQPERGLRT